METVWSVIPPDRPEGWYTWMYVHTVYTDGTTDDSNPVCISGDHGDNGNGIKSVTEYYAVSDSSTQAPNDSRFTVEIQTMTEECPYLWNYEVIEYTLGDIKKSEKRVIGVYGFDGVGIDHITNYYLATSASSGVTKETAGWTDTVQNVTAEKKYLWNYEVITFTDGSTSEDDPCIIGAYGDTGDGIASITDYYAVSPSDTEYPPIYSNAGTEGGDNILTEGGDYVLTETSWTTWTTTRPVKPENWFLWMFTRTVYTDGTVYDTPPICISGADGTILTDTHEQYYLSTSNTTQTGGAWYDAAPDYIMGRYYWTRTITTFSNGIIRYSTPVLNLALTTANSTASTALESASGKNANFYQSGAPSSTGRQVGDLWFVMGTGDNAGKIIGMKEWTGSAWTDTPLTSAVFAFIDAGKITTGILSAILIKSDNNNYWNLSDSAVDGIPARSFKTKNGTFEGTIEGSSFETKTSFQALSGILDLGTSASCKFGKQYPLAGVKEGTFYGEQHSSSSGSAISGSGVELVPGYRGTSTPEYGFVTPQFIAAEELFARNVYVSRRSGSNTILLDLADYVLNGGTYIKVGGILMQWGSASITSVDPQTTKTKAVSFSNTAAGAFSSNPYVFVSGGIENTSDTSGRVGSVNVAARSISSTGFTIRVSNANTTSGTSFDVNVYWLAIGSQS